MRYRVQHRTEYAYSSEVRNSLGLAHLSPRTLPWQHVAAHSLAIDPSPGDLAKDVDFHGNDVTYFHITEAHERLEIEAVSDVTVLAPVYDEETLRAPWESARPLEAPGAHGAWAATEFALPSPKVEQPPEAYEYAARSLLPGRALGDAVIELMHRIHDDFDYDKTATTVTSTVSQVLRQRAGVCQDFAHLALACLRSHGVAARYVSGYLATQPPPGKERVVGADASHAWISVWLPASGSWLALDPTNDQQVGERHVTVAWGRDYGDVPPVKGVIFTTAKKSTLRVAVDVMPLEELTVGS